jgi:hypothetical protein
MKKMQILAIAALAATATFQTAAMAEDPVNPLPGAVCSLYRAPDVNYSQAYDAHLWNDFFAKLKLAETPVLATFVDTAGDFNDTEKLEHIDSHVGRWTGWLQQAKSGTYTFVCTRGDSGIPECIRYSIWINGEKSVEAGYGQTSFNVELNAGFNAVEIITGVFDNEWSFPLTITCKKAGSLQEPAPFGPGDMFHDDEED